MNQIARIILLSITAFISLIFTGCSSIGIYREKQVIEIQEEAHKKGVQLGRHEEIRAKEHARQLALEDKRAKKRYYSIPVVAHMNEDGVEVDAHFVPTQIVEE